MGTEVVFLDDNPDLREVMAELIGSALGVSVLSLESFQEILEAHQSVLNSKVAILDIELGAHQPSGLDVFNWLHQEGYKGKIFFLTGHGKSHPLVREAERSGAIIWEKPTSATTIISALRKWVHMQPQQKEARP